MSTLLLTARYTSTLKSSGRRTVESTRPTTTPLSYTSAPLCSPAADLKWTAILYRPCVPKFVNTKKTAKSPSSARMVKSPTIACLVITLDRDRPDFAPLQELLDDGIRRTANLVDRSV